MRQRHPRRGRPVTPRPLSTAGLRRPFASSAGAPGQPPLWRQLVGSALRRARLRRGWTLRDLAAAARVSLPYLSEIERGRKEVSSEILASICRALGLRLSDLLDEVMQELARVEPARAPGGPHRQSPVAVLCARQRATRLFSDRRAVTLPSS